MKILWVINITPPCAARNLGIGKGSEISWVSAMMERIVSECDVDFALVSPGGKNVKKLLSADIDGVRYFVLPGNGNDEEAWKNLMDSFQPDIVHSYGTEQQQSIPLMKNYTDKVPVVISLQGIITEYKKHYYAGLSKWEILKNYTLYDVIRGGIFEGKRRFEKQSRREAWLLSQVKYAEGRSDWDRVSAKAINPDLKYYYCPRMIRAPFFNYEWKAEECIPHSLFVHQGNYPIKGLHYLLDAVAMLKQQYSDIKLFVSGTDIFSRPKLKTNGYVRMIQRKIEKYGLRDNITYTGLLSADEMGAQLKKMNVCVIPSAIENAPNALAEAMLVGTPCVASYVGGNAEMLHNGECGLIYRYNEPHMLADCVCKYFDNSELAEEKSRNARAAARSDHDPKMLVETIMNIYSEIVADFSKKSYGN